MEKENPIEEARRYVANAEDVIKKSGYDPETKSYLDSKYIKTAGNILWCGCLIALESIFHVRTGKGRPSGFELTNDIIDYCEKLFPVTICA